MHSIVSNLGVIYPLNNPSSLLLKEGSVSAKDHKRDRDFMEVSMAYTGIGIGLDKLEKIFVRFFQVKELLTRKTEGTG